MCELKILILVEGHFKEGKKIFNAFEEKLCSSWDLGQVLPFMSVFDIRDMLRP